MSGDLVLLTGGTGHIGYRTLVQLLEAGYKVRAAVRNQPGFDKIANLPSTKKYQSELTSVVVPDITIPGAYDEAVKGVKYVVHVASPLMGNTKGDDFEATIIKPAVQGTLGILESSAKVGGIERVVITASVGSIADRDHFATGEIIDENTHSVKTEGPYPNQGAAYTASKALAFTASKEWISANKPSFDVINVLPTFAIGRDETVTEAGSIVKGSNSILLGPILGFARTDPAPGCSVHIEDVAAVHVRALDPKIEGNQDFLAAGPDYSRADWTEALDIAKKLYPKEYADGLFKFDDIPKPPTLIARVDSAKASKVLGIEFKSFEEQIKSAVGHYVELVKAN